MKRLTAREGYDLYAGNYRKDHPLLDSFMDGADTEAWTRALDDRLAARQRVVCLDVGCGDGRTLGRWRRRLEKQSLTDRVSLWGADISPKMIEAARGRVPSVTWTVFDLADPAAVEAWRQTSGPADVISAYFVLVHFAKPKAFFAGVRGLLAEGGRLVMNTIPQPSAPELRASGKPIVIEAWDHDAQAVVDAGEAAGFTLQGRREFFGRETGELVSTLLEWSL